MSTLTNLGSIPPPWPMRRFSVDEYHQMIHAGIIGEQDRIELLDGWLVTKTGRNPPHDVAIQLTGEAFGQLLPEGWRIRIHSAVTTLDSEPEPDLAAVRGSPRDFVHRHPDPGDVGMLIEVSESSLAHDRGTKAVIYARAAIAVYWIINLVDSQVEVYTDPTGPDAQPHYRNRQDYGPNDVVPLVVDGQEIERIAVKDLLP